MARYRTINTDLNRQYRNDLNQNFTDIERDINNVSSKVDQVETELKGTIDDLVGGGFIEGLETARDNANTAAINADSKATFANTQGNHAKTQGDYAKTQGDYAKSKGDYADEKAILAGEAAANANLEASNLGGLKIAVVDATQEANLAADKANSAVGPQGDIGPEGPQGIQGDNGEIGPQGEQGIQGIQGEDGPEGDKGDTGDKGEMGTGLTILGSLSNESELPTTGVLGDAYLIDGDLYVWTDTVWENVGNIQGPKGESGEQGIQGVAGLDGEKGEQGIEGPEGPQGERGEDGAGADVSLLATKIELEAESDARIEHIGNLSNPHKVTSQLVNEITPMLVTDLPSTYLRGITVFQLALNAVHPWRDDVGNIGLTNTYALVETNRAVSYAVQRITFMYTTDATTKGTWQREAHAPSSWRKWRKVLNEDDITPEPWIEATLREGWTGYLKYRKNHLGIVELEFNLIAGTVLPNTFISILATRFYSPTILPVPVSIGILSTDSRGDFMNMSEVGRIYVSTSGIKSGELVRGQFSYLAEY